MNNFAVMLKALIIDDEIRARASLNNLLKEYCPQVTVVDMAGDVATAIDMIGIHKPDIVFLDIEMPDQNGFQLLMHFEIPDFEIIFTTAYSEYAVKAFEVSAIDYLLKPLEISKVCAAVEKVGQRQGGHAIRERLHTLKENLSVNQVRQIALPVTEGLQFVQINDIMYLQAEGPYTHVVTSQFKLLICKIIKDFEYLLGEDNRFIRVHRSYIINAQFIKQYIRHNGTFLKMRNDEVIPVARDRKQYFETLIAKIRL